jgi:hypothetical protein
MGTSDPRSVGHDEYWLRPPYMFSYDPRYLSHRLPATEEEFLAAVTKLCPICPAEPNHKCRTERGWEVTAIHAERLPE